MTLKITVENYGTFFIEESCVMELLSWLQQRYKAPVFGEVNHQNFIGNRLINE